MNEIELKNVCVTLGETEILHDVNAEIPCGVSTAIVGPNGAGKSTLTMAILKQVPFKGSIRFPRSEKEKRKIRFGFVPQRLQFDRDIPMTVEDYLLSGIQRRPLFLGRSKHCLDRILPLLEEVECLDLLHHSFGALSGGEIQRVLLAQALLQDPDLLILDEPTSGVDFKGGHICCELLRRVCVKRSITRLIISHDLATVMAHAEKVICLNQTVIAEGSPKDVLTHNVLSTTFGLHLGIPDMSDLPENPMLCNPNTCPHALEHAAHHHHHCDCGHHHEDAGEKHA